MGPQDGWDPGTGSGVGVAGARRGVQTEYPVPALGPHILAAYQLPCLHQIPGPCSAQALKTGPQSNPHPIPTLPLSCPNPEPPLAYGVVTRGPRPADSQPCISEEEVRLHKAPALLKLGSGFSALDTAGGGGTESGLGSRHLRPSVEQLLPAWLEVCSALTVQEESGWRCWIASCPNLTSWWSLAGAHCFLPIPSTQHRWIGVQPLQHIHCSAHPSAPGHTSSVLMV